MKKFFNRKGGLALELVAQKGGGSPVLGDVQGQDGSGSEQPYLAVDMFTAGDLGWMAFRDPFQLK